MYEVSRTLIVDAKGVCKICLYILCIPLRMLAGRKCLLLLKRFEMLFQNVYIEVPRVGKDDISGLSFFSKKPAAAKTF